MTCKVQIHDHLMIHAMSFCHLSLERLLVDQRLLGEELYELTSPYKLTCSGYTMKYENCGGLGHNFKGYQLPLNPDRKKWKLKKYKSKENASLAYVKRRLFSTHITYDFFFLKFNFIEIV
jgi:hypothetical protein